MTDNRFPHRPAYFPTRWCFHARGPRALARQRRCRELLARMGLGKLQPAPAWSGKPGSLFNC
jgi:hypothetical protein